MSRKGWKEVERTAGDLFGLIRYPANMGGRLDFGPRTDVEPPFVGQVKNPRVLSLNAITKLAEEMEEAAEEAEKVQQVGGVQFGKEREHYGVVVVKLSNRRPTPHLVVMTEDTWMRLRALLPFNWEVGARKKGQSDGEEPAREGERQDGNA